MKKDELAQFLHDKRVASGLTQNAVATELGYTTSQFISNWERGISSPPITIVSKLSSMYGISEQSLFEMMVKNTLLRVESSMRDEYKKSRKSK